MPAAAGAQLGAMLRPISTPLILSGFEPASVDLLAGAFGAAGFTPVVGGAVGGQSTSADAPERQMSGALREGDAVGVSLVGGDLEMGATGHDHAYRRRTRSTRSAIRSSTRSRAVPDDPRVRVRDASQPDVVVQDLVDGRSDRNDAAGSRDGHRRDARQGARGGSDVGRRCSRRGKTAPPRSGHSISALAQRPGCSRRC